MNKEIELSDEELEEVSGGALLSHRLPEGLPVLHKGAPIPGSEYVEPDHRAHSESSCCDTLPSPAVSAEPVFCHQAPALNQSPNDIVPNRCVAFSKMLTTQADLKPHSE